VLWNTLRVVEIQELGAHVEADGTCDVGDLMMGTFLRVMRRLAGDLVGWK
jgi:hypothetical protein